MSFALKAMIYYSIGNPDMVRTYKSVQIRDIQCILSLTNYFYKYHTEIIISTKRIGTNIFEHDQDTKSGGLILIQ
jgi:hypothetical protein